MPLSTLSDTDAYTEGAVLRGAHPPHDADAARSAPIHAVAAPEQDGVSSALGIDDLVTGLWHGRCVTLPVVGGIDRRNPPLTIGVYWYRMSLSCP